MRNIKNIRDFEAIWKGFDKFFQNFTFYLFEEKKFLKCRTLHHPRIFQEAASLLLDLVNSYMEDKTVFTAGVTLKLFSILKWGG